MILSSHYSFWSDILDLDVTDMGCSIGFGTQPTSGFGSNTANAGSSFGKFSEYIVLISGLAQLRCSQLICL